MTPTQLDFFRRLCAPFGKDDLFSVNRGGRPLTYIKAPVLMNRLDDVCGPAGWDVEYKSTERGYTCKLGILVPVGDADGGQTQVWHYKEDGGGYEGMTKKVGAETVEDSDNDEKSAYTNAFRRACYTWGLARDLWRCGIPAYLERDPVVFDVPAPAPAPRQAEPAANAPRQYPASDQRKPAPAPAPRPQGGGNYDNFKPPGRPGGAAFKWLCGQEEHFGGGVRKMANDYAKSMGYTFKATEWNEDELRDVAWFVIDQVKNFENYNGEYEHLEDPRLGG